MLRKLRSKDQDKIWYEDDDWDLVIWLDKFHELHGFQISYDKKTQEKALTFSDGAFHSGSVDGGESSYRSNKAPIIVERNDFDCQWFLRELEIRGKDIDKEHLNFICDKIKKAQT